ncbi:NAD-dependent epimerase/dehydratase family protein [Litchfieldella xinjiangensis]|uniref:NAD-dependent epimerase/dehydratase family protein n=1 Tax=Litchfieldella xinjiangensis TaxID=1166948 RepID=UPI0005B9A84C|nr:SDR family oxidoreductase [Halomonas xinjiangensis]
MKILIVGNLGYVGPVVVRHLAERFPEAVIDGYDNAYFAQCLSGPCEAPERYLTRQYYGDVRLLPDGFLDGYSAVVQLAAVSNDPMGHRFESVTRQINEQATVSLANAASVAGVRNFVFASSCSIYGVALEGARSETDPVAPVTAYAHSKVEAERSLASIDSDMVITSLRFATACGMSPRLRLDLVLNDFVACALSQQRITVLSDGSPWRPLIDVQDMARAIEWAIQRPAEQGGRTLSVNTGTNARNHQVRDLAYAVADAVPGTSVCINHEAPADSRSYQVNFDLFADLAPGYQPTMTLQDSIQGLIDGLQKMDFRDSDFRSSAWMRLHVLQRHIDERRLDEQLSWI